MPDHNLTLHLVYLPKPFDRWPIQRIMDLTSGLNYDFTLANAEIDKPAKMHTWSSHNSNPDSGSVIDGPDALALWAYLRNRAIPLKTQPDAYLAVDRQQE